jgi:FAD/FMN-containing dehydrogenase
MSKVAHYLQEHLLGEVISSTDARAFFSTDGSIFQIAPNIIVYPRNENDVRKAARFSWQLAERGRLIPVTARGLGTSQTGAAIGSGMIISFPAHMNRVLELDAKSHTVKVEPGISYSKLQQTLHTHGRYLPPYPMSAEYTTIGGAIANNISGMRSVKFGDTLNYIKGLRVVLANGEVIETGRLSKRDLNKKLGETTFEAEIYRSLDALLEENHVVVERLERGTTINNAGYNLLDIKRKDGSFDLSSLIAGSQGTLGLITEATLDTEEYDPNSTLIVAQFDSIEHMQQAVIELRSMDTPPSSLELIDQYALEEINEINPNRLVDTLKAPFPMFMLFIEYDGNEKVAKKSVRKAEKVLERFAKTFDLYVDQDEKIRQFKVREAVSLIIANNDGLVHPVPLFDGVVPPDRLREYLEGIYRLLAANNIKPAVWGHAGDGNLIVRPKLNMGQVGDKQKAFRLIEDHHRLVLELSGSISGSEGDGRLNTPYLEAMYDPEAYTLLNKVKAIFDPHGTLNPGVKFGTSLDDLKAIVRPDFNIKNLFSQLPRS